MVLTALLMVCLYINKCALCVCNVVSYTLQPEKTIVRGCVDKDETHSDKKNDHTVTLLHPADVSTVHPAGGDRSQY